MINDQVNNSVQQRQEYSIRNGDNVKDSEMVIRQEQSLVL